MTTEPPNPAESSDPKAGKKVSGQTQVSWVWVVVGIVAAIAVAAALAIYNNEVAGSAITKSNGSDQ